MIMDRNSQYFKQAQLLVRMLPYIAKHDCFALKGGTAINLFVRNLLRLSIDIDLVYVPIADRNSSLSHMDRELRMIANELKKQILDMAVIVPSLQGNDFIFKIVAQHQNAHVKVEVSPVGRGVVFNVSSKDICAKAQEEFGFASMNVVSFEDLYAGKICAALDRQHPRDLFDIKVLFENEGVSNDLLRAFLVYLISCNRPIAELLSPKFSDLNQEYVTDFTGMSFVEISLKELEQTRELLVTRIHSMLNDEYKKFLMLFKQGNPDWGLLGLDGVSKLPAVQWKLYNLNQMSASRRKMAVEKLEKILYR